MVVEDFYLGFVYIYPVFVDKTDNVHELRDLNATMYFNVSYFIY
jgi:hypothetical protein